MKKKFRILKETKRNGESNYRIQYKEWIFWKDYRSLEFYGNKLNWKYYSYYNRLQQAQDELANIKSKEKRIEQTNHMSQIISTEVINDELE